MCDQAHQKGLLSGIKVARGCPAITHLLFADDTMFFCRSNSSNVSTLLSILRDYETLSGQRINFSKSAITFASKTPAEVRARVKSTLSIDAEGGLGKYLGLPEHFGRKKRDIFASILDRIRQKTLSWKNKFLSGAGKQVLLKAVLQAMPTYSMSCFKLPGSLCKQIQSLLTRFWWDANPDQRKMCWVAWSTLTLPKHAGGLGFRDISAFNDALLAKIGWRILQHPTSLIAQVLLGKYARNSSFLECSAPSKMSHGWRSILAGREILKMGLGWIVGDGSKIRVWKDPWLSCDKPLTPYGPPNAHDGDLMVCDLLCPITNSWNRDQIQSLLPQYNDLIQAIVTSSAPATDHLAWLLDKSGCYTTKTGYGIATTTTADQETNLSSFNWVKSIWNIKTSPKLKDFLWKVVCKAIPVSSNLVKRGMQAFKCKTCDGEEDDLHVFLNCSIAQQVWSMAPLVNIPSANVSSIASLFSVAPTLTVLPPVGLTIPLWPWLLWNLWKARNKLCFDNKAFIAMDIITKSISDAREWQMAQAPSTDSVQSRHPSNTPAHRPQPHEVSPGILICNVDGAWDVRTGFSGTGGVFSAGCNRVPLEHISSSRKHVSSALMAECLAIRSAVMYTASLNIKSLMILSDSLSLIKLLKSGGSIPALFGILFDIYHFSTLFDIISFSYVPRVGNGVADSVAKSALSLLISSDNGV